MPVLLMGLTALFVFAVVGIILIIAMAVGRRDERAASEDTSTELAKTAK